MSLSPNALPGLTPSFAASLQPRTYWQSVVTTQRRPNRLQAQLRIQGRRIHESSYSTCALSHIPWLALCHSGGMAGAVDRAQVGRIAAAAHRTSVRPAVLRLCQVDGKIHSAASWLE